MTSLRNMRCILRTPPIVNAPLECRMNEAWRFRRPRRLATARKHSMLWSLTPPEIFLPHAMGAPDVSPSSAEPKLDPYEPVRARPILDPRNGDAEDDVSSPKQKSLLA